MRLANWFIFFSHLFSPSVMFMEIQVNTNDIEDDDDESDFTKGKVMKIKSLY